MGLWRKSSVTNFCAATSTPRNTACSLTAEAGRDHAGALFSLSEAPRYYFSGGEIRYSYRSASTGIQARRA